MKSEAARQNWGYQGHYMGKKVAPKLGEEPVRTGEDLLRRIVEDSFGVDGGSLDGATRMAEDLGFDSLDFTELAMRIEEAFGLDFGDEVDFERLRTFGGWLRAVRKVRGGAVGLPVGV